jgi:prevent-host-death family protein
MKSINVREFQHSLGRVLDQVERGETFQILRRSKPVARIVPLEVSHRPKPWPDLLKRLSSIYGKKRISSPTAELIYQDREKP